MCYNCPCALILTRACTGAGERSVLWQSRSRAGGRECEHRQWSTPSTVVNISIAGQHVSPGSLVNTASIRQLQVDTSRHNLLL